MTTNQQMLKRQIGVFGAVMLGLGSIIGTGVFVSIGVAAGIAGPAVILAILIGAMVATFNGLNSAQLAANHPVSGGTYEYGYRYLNPRLGFVAGWTFLLAKSASAATAALGFAGYLLNVVGGSVDWLVPLALAAVIVLTLIILGGIRRSNIVNTVIVSLTLGTLGLFIVSGALNLPSVEVNHFQPFFDDSSGFTSTVQAVLYASALMFVAYTGYGRIATLGEEVREPRRTIPRAIVATLVVTMILYVGVAIVGVGTIGAGALSQAAAVEAAPLEVAARSFDGGTIPALVALGAVTAMLGVLLNLILGLSRVLLAMGRRRDMPPPVGRLNASETTPIVAVIVMGVFIGGLVLIGDVKTTWSFSAFTVLIYYAITNLSALQLKAEDRIFPRWTAWAGLISCLFLAFWVEVSVWLAGVAIIAAGLVWQMIATRIYAER